MKPFIPVIPSGFETEMIYSFVIILCCLMIYFGTKNIYKLSSYKGINYFRSAFLFFAIALFFHSFIKFILFYFKFGRIIDFRFGAIPMFLFMYFSLISIFYLIYSIVWKKWRNIRVFHFHIVALIISLISILFRTPDLYLLLNLLLFIFLVVIVYNLYKKSKNKNLYLIYSLLLIFWILNIIDVMIPNFFQFQIIIYLASLTIFMAITYKVLKKIG
ncbi:hypothetical protein J4446_02780 [Candidatus Woesearchaeota archaeon]|nr:hypothetical protein [Candidatus Woesearchaeota archaeon]